MDRSLSAERNIFPRWRSIDRTPSTELVSSCTPKETPDTYQQELLEFTYKKWQTNPSLELAFEVVNVALTMNTPYLAIGPAKMIVDSPHAMPAAKIVANTVLTGPKTHKIENERIALTRQQIGEQIRQVKIRLINEPLNGLAWLEKARLHTRIGNRSHAEKSIRVALGCAPNNRFILRAFTRFMTHIGTPIEAHNYIKSSDGIKSDPWIQSAEISVAEAAGRPPISARWGMQTLEQKHLSPAHTSELASALGTLEFNSGKSKKAKRLFHNSLQLPTENALAQAYWVQQEKSLGVMIDKQMLTLDGAFEARVQNAVSEYEWEAVTRHCISWLEDEPFSLRAATDGSFYSSSCLKDDLLAIYFCDSGLLANPYDTTLINNKIVSLCRLNEIEKANSLIDKCPRFTQDITSDPIAMATMGLFAFRSGSKAEGRNWYQSALEGAKKASTLDTVVRVKYHWLYEEARSKSLSAELLESLIEEIDKQLKNIGVRFITSTTWNIMKKDIRNFGCEGSIDTAPAIITTAI